MINVVSGHVTRPRRAVSKRCRAERMYDPDGRGDTPPISTCPARSLLMCCAAACARVIVLTRAGNRRARRPRRADRQRRSADGIGAIPHSPVPTNPHEARSKVHRLTLHRAAPGTRRRRRAPVGEPVAIVIAKHRPGDDAAERVQVATKRFLA